MNKTLLPILAAALATAAQASLLYDNGAPDQSSGNEMTQWIQADDFVLSGPSTVRSGTFWSLEDPGAFQGSIEYFIFGNGVGGTPTGAPLYAGPLTIMGRTPGAQDAIPGLTLDEFRYDFCIPDAFLEKGTYWLGLHNGPLATDQRLEFYWETTGVGGNSFGHEDFTPFLDSGWLSNGQEHAFFLTDNAWRQDIIPEGEFGLGVGGAFAAAMAGWVIRRRRAAAK